MDIIELINLGRSIEHGLRPVPPPDGVIRLYSLYRPDNIDEYYRWKEHSIRFLQLYSPADQERFVEYSNKFEQHFLSKYISNMIGVLEACESMPSEKLSKLKEEAERNSDIDKVEALEQIYLSQTTDDRIHLSSAAFHQWHAAACVLFDKWFYSTEDDWVKFQSVDANGNGYSLFGEFEQIYSPYKKLMARLKDGRNLRSAVSKRSMSSVGQRPLKKINIFISYSHSDEIWLERLKKHLKVLARNSDSVEYWEDTKLRGGDKWKGEIERAIDRANVAVLLVSTDFLASDFIANDELPPILHNAEQRGTRILPIIVSPCAFEMSELNDFQAVNSPDRTLLDMKDDNAAIERVYLELVKTIRELL